MLESTLRDLRDVPLTALPAAEVIARLVPAAPAVKMTTALRRVRSGWSRLVRLTLPSLHSF